MSSTATVTSEGGFEISYVTEGSGVKGDWVKDDFSVGNITIKGFSLAVATQAEGLPTGIMGIGFPVDESNTTQYPNFVDQMVQQGLTKSRSYSLWLDDIGMFPGPSYIVISLLNWNARQQHRECAFWWIRL